jgi:hypothetical protein
MTAPEHPTTSVAVRRVADELAGKNWATQISLADPRFGARLALLGPGAANPLEVARTLAQGSYTPTEALATHAALRMFVDAVDAGEHLTLEQELDQIVEVATRGERGKVLVMARLGFGGLPPVTLAVAGGFLGVTRERARQIEQAFRGVIAACSRPWLPVLDRALQLLDEQAPLSDSELLGCLRGGGVISSEFSVASLASAADVFGRELPFVIRSNDGAVAPIGNWPPDQLVRRIVRELVEHRGAANLDELKARVVAAGFDPQDRVLVQALERIPGFRWLDVGHRWFWQTDLNNRTLNLVRKIMSVAGSIDMVDLRIGLGRPHKVRGYRPPREVLLALCADTGIYRWEGTTLVHRGDPADWREVLARNERLLVGALLEAGPVMRRVDLESLVVDRLGLNHDSFYIYLTYSPVIQRYGPGVYGLVGAPVSAEQIAAMIDPGARTPVLQQHGWTSDGRLWSAFRISRKCKSTAVLTTPAAVRAVTSGPFVLRVEDGTSVGVLFIDDKIWGLEECFRRWNVDVGEIVVIILELSDRDATVLVGTGELLLKYQSDL